MSDRAPRFGVVTFPGTLDDRDAQRAVATMGGDPVALWHADRDLRGAEAVILPGGFSYGDYLRAGAIAARAPVMDEIVAFADRGGPVLGICNGFQILCEAGLLPGALIRNRSLRFICREVYAPRRDRADRGDPRAGARRDVRIPMKHGEGQWVATADQLATVEGEGLVTFRYSSPDGIVDDAHNPNGATNNIAGVRNEGGNVVGLMPHPEHAVDPDVGPTGGQALFASLLQAALAGAAA